MNNLLKAMALFQQECPIIKKERSNDFGKYKYTDLTDVVITIKPLLEKHGLAFYQLTDEYNLRTVVYHIESGERLECSMPIPTDVELKGMNKYQVLGSGISYLRKYQLTAMLGIVSDEKSLDELKPETKEKKKPTLSDERFQNALKAIQNEETTKDKVIEKFHLTDEQTKQINEL